MTIGDDLDRTLDGLATRIDEADATLSMIREDAGVDWSRLEQRITALTDRVTSLESGDPDVPIIPPVVVPPPVVAPSGGGTVNVTGPSWTRYFRQARDLTGSDAGWGKLLFGQLGKDQALTARDTDDGIYTFGEAIDSLDAATKTPDPPFSMSANPSPKLPYGIEAAQPGHPFHARWETWARTFWRSVAAEQAAGHLTPGFLYAYGMEMTGWYERVGTTAAYSIHPKSGRNPDVYGYAFAVEQRIAREEGADARFVFAPNTPISARRPIIEAAAASIRQHGGTVDVASMSFYTYGSDSHYPLTSSSRSGLPLDQALDYMHGVFPHSALGINETGTKRGQLDRVRKAVETFQVAADYDAVNVNLFCALKGEGDYRVFSDGTPTMDTPKDRGERAAIVAAAHDYIQAGR